MKDKDIIFVGNESPNFKVNYFVYKFIKNLPKKEKLAYGLRQDRNGKYFIITCNNKQFIAYSIEDYFGLSACKIGLVDYELNKKRKNLHIKLIKVDEVFQGQGIGNGIMEFIKATAKDMGMKTITLDCLSKYTDGINTVAIRHDPEEREKLEELKKSGNPIVDKNKKFYLKHGFIKQKNREPEAEYLTPMINAKIKPAKPPVNNIKQIFRFTKLTLNRNYDVFNNYKVKNIENIEKNKKYSVLLIKDIKLK